MIYKTYYDSPVGNILLLSNENTLIRLSIEGQKYYIDKADNKIPQKNDIEIFVQTKEWLDRYFEGKKPKISELKIDITGNEFRKNVWKILCEIPYGKTITYGEIARKVAKNMNKKTMSAQAVGGAVGNNPISIIIPCHRVVGKNGNLTGYSGGIDKKIQLLNIENVNIENLYVPKR